MYIVQLKITHICLCFHKTWCIFCRILASTLSEFFNLENDLKKSNSHPLLTLPICQALLVLHMHCLVTYNKLMS